MPDAGCRSRIQRTLSSQLLRSGTSIGANVEEAHGSQSKADFTAKLSITCNEARETHYWIRLLTASELVPEKRVQDMTDEANQLIAILTAIVKNAVVPPDSASAFHSSPFAIHSS